MGWDGTDRRRTAPTDARLDALESRLSSLEETLQEMKDAWLQMQGVFKFFRFLFFVCGPVVAAGYWVKEHVKF